MIERYTLPEMGELWTDRARYQRWLDVEVLAAQAMAELGQIPAEAAQAIALNAAFDPLRIAQIEAEVRHDVIAFLTDVGERVGEPARWIHLGMTSSDTLDTALAATLLEAGRILTCRLAKLMDTVARRAQEHRRTPCIGRSHGIHAEPMSFGLKLAQWYAELARGRERLTHALEQVRYGKISGAVGTFANVDPRVEAYVCARLGLRPDPASTQIVQRDRHAHFVQALALLGTSIDRFATELRHLQRTEVAEVEEGFSRGQKGSSAMPHKRNPITGELMGGLARLLRSHAQVALDNVVLWHERDISHSSAERVILPDATIALHCMLVRFEGVMDRLVVKPDRMRKNLEMTGGLIYSQRILLELVRAGASRERGYARVQALAFQAMEQNRPFQDLCLADAELAELLGADRLKSCFDLDYHLAHVDTIFDRVFSNPPLPEGLSTDLCN